MTTLLLNGCVIEKPLRDALLEIIVSTEKIVVSVLFPSVSKKNYTNLYANKFDGLLLNEKKNVPCRYGPTHSH